MKLFVIMGTVVLVQFFCVLGGLFVVRGTVGIVQWYCVLCVVYCGCNNSGYSSILLCGVCGYFVITKSVDLVKCFCFVCVDFCGYSNSKCSAILLCCIWKFLWLLQQYLLCNATVYCADFIVITATLLLGQRYCVVFVDFYDYINTRYSGMFLGSVWVFYCVIAPVGVVKFYSVLFGAYCGYSNNEYRSTILCFVWSLLLLQQQ